MTNSHNINQPEHKVVCPLLQLSLRLKLLKRISADQHRTIGFQAFLNIYQTSLKAAVCDFKLCFLLTKLFTVRRFFTYDLNTSSSNAPDCKMVSVWGTAFSPCLPFLLNSMSDIYQKSATGSVLFPLHPR